MAMTPKWRAITLLVVAETLSLILWFTSAAVLPDMAREGAISEARQAWLSSGVQGGFVVGALLIAIIGIADRLDPRKVLCASAFLGALANLALLAAPLGSDLAIALRVFTGAMMAGVYPIGMKIAFGWGLKDRGLLVGLLIGGLTLGKATPYLLAFASGTDWRLAIIAASGLATLGGLTGLLVGLGPNHARARSFDPLSIRLAWTNKTIRRAYGGYLGHMWELYVFWGWIATASAASYAATLGQHDAESLGKLTAFLAVALGAPACVLAGRYADRIGKAEVTLIVLLLSGAGALLTAISFGGPVWLTFVLAVLWGITVAPDSAQFSAIVADNAPPELSGSLLTLQTALGFGLTIITVQVAPMLAAVWSWPVVLALLALGPAFGIASMWPLRRKAQTSRTSSM